MESSRPATVDFFAIINRRKWSFIIPCFLVIITALGLCVYLPSIYQSTAKIIVKPPEISSYYVQQSVSSYAEERVRAIKNKILSRQQLKSAIEKDAFLSDLQSRQAAKENYLFGIGRYTRISNVTDEVDILGSPNALVFAISYENDDPEVAQKVTKMLTAMFLQENINIRRKQATGITDFLEKEMGKLKKELAVIENSITLFKQKHINELPTLLQVNIQRLQGLEVKQEGLQEQLLKQKDIRQDLRAQLASIPQQSKELTDRRKLVELETRLANLRSQYSESYPDVIQAKVELAKLEEKIKAGSKEGAADRHAIENPEYLKLHAQLASVDNEIESLQRQLEELKQKEDEYNARIETTLRIEDEYNALLNKRKSTQGKYDDLMKKLMEAKVSRGLEEEQKGEQFTLLQSATFPRTPYKPNRLAILLLGCFLGVGLGVGLVALLEYFDHSIRDVDSLTAISSQPVLGCIPFIHKEEDTAKKRRITSLLVILISVCCIGTLLIWALFSSFNIVERIKLLIG